MALPMSSMITHTMTRPAEPAQEEEIPSTPPLKRSSAGMHLEVANSSKEDVVPDTPPVIYQNPRRGGQLQWWDSHSWDTSVEKAIFRNPIRSENLFYLILCYSLWNYKVYTETNNFFYSFMAWQKTFLPGGSEHPVQFMFQSIKPGICASAWGYARADVHPTGESILSENRVSSWKRMEKKDHRSSPDRD